MSDEGETSPALGGDRAMLRSSAVMTVGTLLSRVTGYLRSFLLVVALGLALQADLFTVANTVPNALYILVAGGVLNAVLVPQLVRSMRNDEDGGTAYANRVLTLVGLVLLVTTVLAVVFAPTLMRLYAPSELYRPELADARHSLEVFARLCLPQVFFYGVYVLVGQVLNARGRFGPMMFAPIANNIVACAMLGLYLLLYESGSGSEPYTTNQELLLGLGSTLGVAVQAIVLVPYVRAVGLRYRPRFDFRGTGLRQTGELALWTVLLVAVNQVAYLVVTRLAVQGSATALISGESQAVGATVYQNAYLLVMLPHALITVSLVTALLPRMSSHVTNGRLADMRRDLLSTMRLAVAGSVAAGFGLVAVALPLTQLLFGWGAGAGETRSLAFTVMLFVPGLIAFTIHFVTLRGFFALENTKTPFLIQCVVAVANITSALLISAIVGRPSAMILAGGFSIAYTIGAVVSTAALARRLGGLERVALLWFLLRAAAAALPAAVIAYVGARLGEWVAGAAADGGTSRLGALLAVLLAGALAVPTYVLTAEKLRVREVSEVVDMVTSRLRRGRRTPAPGFEPPTMDTVNDNESTVVGLPRWEDGPDADVPATPPASAAQRVPEAVVASAPPQRSELAEGGQLDKPGELNEQGQRDRGGGPMATPSVEPGAKIAGRYRLVELLAVTDGAVTWRGMDEVLSRPVALHLLARDDPRADALTEAARNAASVADPHFLRMLDVSADDEHIYIVREWVAGRNLAQALVNGPFEAEDATYVARELAAALANAHRAGLSHLRLEPDTIVLADSGQVKVVDVGVDQVLHGTSVQDAAQADALGLGRVLYALLTARWPGGPVPGMVGAPTQDGRVCSPRQVLAGVPGPLDELTDRILGDPPRANREPLRSPGDIEEALDYVAGRPARRRVLNLPPPPPALPMEPDVESTATWHRPDQPPAPLPTAPAAAPGRGRRALWWTVGALVAVGVVLLGYQIVRQVTDGADTAGPNSTPSSAPVAVAANPLTATATAYDPVYDTGVPGLDSGSGDENDSLAPNAVDGDPATSWTTVNYFDPIERLKPGVGLLLDLGAVHTVTGAELTLLTAGGTLELRAAPETATEAPKSPNDFTVVATEADPPADVEVTLDAPVTTRFVLVWFTVLPQYEGNYKDGVAEAVVLGE